MNFASKLSWEIVALNDRGDSDEKQRLALEIAYGVSLQVPDYDTFARIMAHIALQVTDAEMVKYLRFYTNKAKV